MASEIVMLITELRNRQRITLPSAKGAYSFGRSPHCDYILRRNHIGDRQFTLHSRGENWVVTDDASGCTTWYNNHPLAGGESHLLQPGDVIGINTDEDLST